jgi:hypothetical protein
VNTDPLAQRDVIVQAGAFGEHTFIDVRDVDAPEEAPIPVRARTLRVALGPSAQVRLDLCVERFANSPSYAFPSFERAEGV